MCDLHSVNAQRKKDDAKSCSEWRIHHGTHHTHLTWQAMLFILHPSIVEVFHQISLLILTLTSSSPPASPTALPSLFMRIINFSVCCSSIFIGMHSDCIRCIPRWDCSQHSIYKQIYECKTSQQCSAYDQTRSLWTNNNGNQCQYIIFPANSFD